MAIPTSHYYMQLALEQAVLAKKLGEYPFGAVVVCNGSVVGQGKCEDKTTGDVTDHAEMLALRQACRTLKRNRLGDCTMYCTNEPCAMCAAAIFQAKIAHVIIGVMRDDLPHLLRPRKIRIADLAADSGYPITIESGMLKEEILKQFADVPMST